MHAENSAEKQNGVDSAKAFDAVLKKLTEVLLSRARRCVNMRLRAYPPPPFADRVSNRADV